MENRITNFQSADAKQIGRVRATGVFCIGWFVETVRFGVEHSNAVNSVYQALGYMLLVVPASFICASVLSGVGKLIGLRLWQLWAVTFLSWTVYDLLAGVFRW